MTHTTTLDAADPAVVHVHTTVCGVSFAYQPLTRSMYPLTGCCQAATKATGDGDLVCRGCGKTVPGRYGTGADTIADAYRMVTGVVTEDGFKGRGCPCPDTCADEALWWMERSLDERA